MANDYTKFPTEVYEGYKTAGKPIPNCSRPLQEGIKVSSITFTADSGHTQSRKKADSKRTFSPSYLVLTADQYFTIRDFFFKKTNVESFNWLHPLEKIYIRTKFAMDALSGENFAHNMQGPLFKLQISLEQVWDNG